MLEVVHGPYVQVAKTIGNPAGGLVTARRAAASPAGGAANVWHPVYRDRSHSWRGHPTHHGRGLYRETPAELYTVYYRRARGLVAIT